MIVVHYLEESRANRIVWLLEELNLPYEIKVYYRNPKTHHAPPELAEVHPSAASPILTDGEYTIPESGLIVEYLIETYGKDSELAVKSPEESLHVRYGVMQCESNFMIAAMQIFVNSFARKQLPWGLGMFGNKLLDTIEKGYAKPELLLSLDMLDNTIKDNGGYYSNGHLTGADIMYDTSVNLVRMLSVVKDFNARFPNIAQWQKTIAQRPAYKKMLQIAADVRTNKPSKSKL